jgi:hypothetical protein
MAVGAQDAAAHAVVLHAARHLILGALVVLAEKLRVVLGSIDRPLLVGLYRLADIGRSRIPIVRTRFVNARPEAPSLSRTK